MFFFFFWIVCEKYNTCHPSCGLQVMMRDMMLFCSRHNSVHLKDQKLVRIDEGSLAQGSNSPTQTSDLIKKCCALK
jgi:hypothetical protein